VSKLSVESLKNERQAQASNTIDATDVSIPGHSCDEDLFAGAQRAVDVIPGGPIKEAYHCNPLIVSLVCMGWV